ncbi:uncharacterized protein LOC144123525 [Amblyomma americanum]
MAAAAALYAVLLAAQLGHAAASAEPGQPTPLLLVEGRRVLLPISRASDDQGGMLNINGTVVGVHDSRLPAMLLSLYENVSRLILAEKDPELRVAFRDSLKDTMLKNIEKFVVPGMDDKKRAKIRRLKFGSVSDEFYNAERYVLVGIIVVVVTLSLVVLVYWFVAYVISGAMRRSPSDIGITELEDLDVYSTDDDGSSAGRYNRARRIGLVPGRALLGYRRLP